MIITPFSFQIDTNSSTSTTLKKDNIEFVSPILNRLIHNEDYFKSIPMLELLIDGNQINSGSIGIKIDSFQSIQKTTITFDDVEDENYFDTSVKLKSSKVFSFKGTVRRISKFSPKISLD